MKHGIFRFMIPWFVLGAPLLLAAAVGTGGEPELSQTQRRLLSEFAVFRPEGAEPGGVWMLETWDTDIGLERLVSLPTASGNAALHFKRLEERYPSEEEFLGVRETAGELELLAAAELAYCRFSPDHYPEFDRTDSPQPDIRIFRAYLDSLLASAERTENEGGGAAEAERRIRAALLCGRLLTRDRSTLAVYTTGLIFKVKAAQAYELFLRRRGRDEQAVLAKAYHGRIAEVLRLMNWKAKSGLGAFEDFASLPVALEVAKRDKEPCWRAEAVIMLAIFRHGAPDEGLMEVRRNPLWEQEAEKGLAHVASADPSPAIRRLAAWSVLAVRPEMFADMSHLFGE